MTSTQGVLPASRRNVGPYRLCIELASGGMASVYLARPRHCGSRPAMVAVKIIHTHLANDAQFIQMFMDEAELAAQIRHANVCSVLDYGKDGEHYIAMEYLLGESLMSLWNRVSRLEGNDQDRQARYIARILSDACEGLHAAHELSDADDECLELVHRDVSPENVFVTYDGVAKVMDFGIASAARKRHKTQTGLVKGKFGYIAPECLRGEKADRRADVWGIGVVAWELLTGQRLFRRDTDLETLRAVSEQPIVKPSQARDGLPREIDKIVMKALERDPEARYPTARALARELARFSAHGKDVVTCSDIADWLEVLAPGSKARRQQIVDLAKCIEDDHSVTTPPPPPPELRPSLEAGTETRISAPPEYGPPAAGATQIWRGRARRARRPPPIPLRARRTAGLAQAGAILAAGAALGGALAHAWQARGDGVAPSGRATLGAITSSVVDQEQPAASSGAKPGEIWLRIRVEPEADVARPAPQPQPQATGGTHAALRLPPPAP